MTINKSKDPAACWIQKSNSEFLLSFFDRSEFSGGNMNRKQNEKTHHGDTKPVSHIARNVKQNKYNYDTLKNPLQIDISKRYIGMTGIINISQWTNSRSFPTLTDAMTRRYPRLLVFAAAASLTRGIIENRSVVIRLVRL